MRITWLATAKRDFVSQIAFVGERNPNAAVRLGDNVHAAVRALLDHPLLGRPGRVSGTRELVIRNTPYVMVYRIEKDRIALLRLLHGAQRWPPAP